MRPTRWVKRPRGFKLANRTNQFLVQIDVSVNATESGTIKELLVKEEDTVAVDQDLVKVEVGGAPPEKKEQPAEKPKEQPAEKPKEEPAEKPEEPAAEKPQEQPTQKPKEPEPSKPSPPPSGQAQAPKPQPESPKPEPPSGAPPAAGTREERRVRVHSTSSLPS